MNRSLVRQLIVKDFQFHRISIVASIIVGVLALAILQFRGLMGLFGIIGYFTAMIVFGSMLAQSIIVGERKAQNLAFLMSLPISVTQYTTAKILAALGVFLVPWLTLVGGALWVIRGSSALPDGLIPVTLIVVTLPLIGFCVMTSVALVSESEGWAIASTVAVNVAYSFVWPLIAFNAELRSSFSSSTPVWNTTVLTVLGSEFAVIAGLLAITFYLQSRKRDFV
jgi:hypothetical protein